MVIYTCNVCFKSFNKKSNYLAHTENKKKPCRQIEEIITNSTQIPHKLTLSPQNSTQNIESTLREEDIKAQKILNTKDDKKCKEIMLEEKSKDSNIIQKNESMTNNLSEDEEIINKCGYCFKEFSRTDALRRHLKTYCKVKKLEDEKKENILNNLIEKEKKTNELYDIVCNMNNNFNEIKEDNKYLVELAETLKKQNDELNKKNSELERKINDILKKNTGNTQNITNNTQINNINITNYKINPFGKETFDKLDRKEVLKIMTDIRNNGKFCFNKLIDLIHFNVNIPENQNVYMGDYNRGKFMVHDGTDWNLNQNEEYIIFEVLEHVRNLFNEYNDEEFEQKLERDVLFRQNFNTAFKKYFDYIYDEVADADLSNDELKKKYNFKKMMSSEVKNKLYNKRQIPIDTHEKFKNILNNKLLENYTISKN